MELTSDPRLLISTVGFVLGAIISVSLSVFVFLKDRKRPLYILFMLMNLMIAVFQISHAIGINITDGVLSRQVFMFNVANVFLSSFFAHWIFVLIKRDRQHQKFIIGSYAVSFILFAIYVLFPDTFLLTSTPKMYMPSYYVPGSLHWIMRLVSNVVVPFYALFFLFREYVTTSDVKEKNRYRYVIFGTVVGFGAGGTAVLLVYNILFDPVWATLCIIYAPILAYAIGKESLMDVRVISKVATLYTTVVVSLVFLIGLNNKIYSLVAVQYFGWPQIGSSITLAILIVVLGYVVWNKLKDSEILRYEFINIVSHKFRTPVTKIKWASDALLQTSLSDDQKVNVNVIVQSADTILGLTDLLSNAEKKDEGKYHLEVFSVRDLVEDVCQVQKSNSESKKVTLDIDVAPDLKILVDKMKFIYATETVLENAILYSNEGSSVRILAGRRDKKIFISITDIGIGISKKDRRMIFNQFYRGEKARRLFTEGMGIGLYFARDMVRRMNGDLNFESAGEGLGSTFTITVPVAAT